MLYSTYAEAVPEDYGTSPPGPSWARGSTCAAVLTHVFNHEHAEIAAKLPKLKIARIRIEEHRGLVVLSFHKIPQAKSESCAKATPGESRHSSTTLCPETESNGSWSSKRTE